MSLVTHSVQTGSEISGISPGEKRSGLEAERVGVQWLWLALSKDPTDVFSVWSKLFIRDPKEESGNWGQLLLRDPTEMFGDWGQLFIRDPAEVSSDWGQLLLRNPTEVSSDCS
jgi:hypothetical protein